MRVTVFSDRRFEGERLLSDFLRRSDDVHGNFHPLCDFFRAWLASELLHELLAGAHLFADALDHVHGYANGARLVSNRTSDRLPDPPCSVSGEFVSPAPLELVGAPH